MTLLGTLRTWLRSSDGRLEVAVRSDLTDAAAIPTTGAVTAGIAAGGGSGIFRNTHTHDTAGALSIARAGADQYTEVTISANATSWADNLTTSGDNLSVFLLGDGGATSYTVDLTAALAGIDTTFTIHPDTEIELSIVKRGANLWTISTVRAAGTPTAASLVGVAVDGNNWAGPQTNPAAPIPTGAQAGDEAWVYATGDNVTLTDIGDGTSTLTTAQTFNTVRSTYAIIGRRVTLTAADITAGNISTAGTGIYGIATAAVRGASTFGASAVADTSTSQAVGSPAVTVPDGTVVMSFLADYNASGAATAPANMNDAVANDTGQTNTRKMAVAAELVATAATFTPDDWTFGVGHEAMAVTVTAAP